MKYIDEYIEWEEKVEKTFEYHQADEFSKFSMTKLCFQ